MKERLLIFLTCCALTIGVIGHFSCVPMDWGSGSAISAVHPAEPTGDSFVLSSGAGMDGCSWHIEHSSDECHIDVNAPLASLDVVHDVLGPENWIKTGLSLKAEAVPPLNPPPISVS